MLKEKRFEKTKKEPNKILKKAAAIDVASVVDRKTVVPGVPPTEVRVKTGFNCVIVIEIAGMKFRVVLDTGAARDVIRTSFAEQLRKNARTKKASAATKRGMDFEPGPVSPRRWGSCSCRR